MGLSGGLRLMNVAGADARPERYRRSSGCGLSLVLQSRRRIGGRGCVECAQVLNCRTRPVGGRRRCDVPSRLNKLCHSWVLDWRSSRVLLQRVPSDLLTVRGRELGLIRGCTRRRRQELGGVSSLTGDRSRREEYEVRSRGRVLQLCCRQGALRWGLRKPCLVVIRVERRYVERENCCGRKGA